MESQESKRSPLWVAFGKVEKFLDKVLIFCAASIWIFTVAMIVIFCLKGEVPDTLIEKFFSAFSIEGALCAVITVVKTIMSKLINKGLNLPDVEGYDENEPAE